MKEIEGETRIEAEIGTGTERLGGNGTGTEGGKSYMVGIVAPHLIVSHAHSSCLANSTNTGSCRE